MDFFSLISSASVIMLIHEDENGKKWGKYVIPNHLKEREGFGEVAIYLENFKLLLDDENYSNFSIYQTYLNYPHHDKSQSLPAPEPISLKDYFPNNTTNSSTNPIDRSYLHAPHSPENFKKAEKELVAQMLNKFNPETSAFLPVVLDPGGKIQGMIYLIFDNSVS